MKADWAIDKAIFKGQVKNENSYHRTTGINTMYPLPESFNPSFLFGKTVDVISFGPYQIDIYFTENRWIHMEGAYRLLAGSSIVEELMKYPVRQSSLMQILGSTVLNVTYKSNGNLCLEFDCKKQLWICGDNGPYESYRLFDGEREILV